ncbi:MAG: methionine synthase [Clostridia bacterium]|nr:methionine synthase [Clostridia bacterium]
MNSLSFGSLNGDWRRMARGFLRMKEEGCEELFDEAEKLLEERISPGYTWRLCPIEFSDAGVKCLGTGLVLPGGDIRRHLSGCERASLMCVTLGEGAESAVRTAAGISQALGAVTDAAASAFAELAADAAEKEIAAAVGAAETASRFSPGYGDLPLGIQGDFLASLNAKRTLGVALSKGGLMLPRKTVTAVIGVKK